MNTAVSIVLLAAVLGVIVFLLSRRENGRRSQYGPSGLSEFRTDLPLDECFDRLDEHPDTDEFLYECHREKDGGFLLHLTLHQPTQQPLDTLYSLRLDPGRQTVVTLIFIREAFGYKEPLFPQEMLDKFMLQKLAAHPQNKLLRQNAFHFALNLVYWYMPQRRICGLVAQLVRAGGS